MSEHAKARHGRRDIEVDVHAIIHPEAPEILASHEGEVERQTIVHGSRQQAGEQRAEALNESFVGKCAADYLDDPARLCSVVLPIGFPLVICCGTIKASTSWRGDWKLYAMI